MKKKSVLIIIAIAAVILFFVVNALIKSINDVRTDFDNFLAKTFNPTAYAEVEKYAKEQNSEYLDLEDYLNRKITVSTRGLNVLYKINYNYALSNYEKKHLNERIKDYNGIFCKAFSDAKEKSSAIKGIYFEYRDKNGVICVAKPNFKKYESDTKAISDFIQPHKSILGGKYELSSDGTEVICKYSHDTTGMSDIEKMNLIGPTDYIDAKAYIALTKFRRECPEVTSFTFLHEDLNSNELYKYTASVTERDVFLMAYAYLFAEEKSLGLPAGVSWSLNVVGEDLEFYICFSALESAMDSREREDFSFQRYYPYIFDEMNETFKEIKKECPEVSSIICYYCDQNANPFNYEVFGEPRSGALYSHSMKYMPHSRISSPGLRFPYPLRNYNLNIRKNSYVIGYKFDITDDSFEEINEACSTFIEQNEKYYQNFLNILRKEVPELKSIIIDFYTYTGDYVYYAEFN